AAPTGCAAQATVEVVGPGEPASTAPQLCAAGRGGSSAPADMGEVAAAAPISRAAAIAPRLRRPLYALREALRFVVGGVLHRDQRDPTMLARSILPVSRLAYIGQPAYMAGRVRDHYRARGSAGRGVILAGSSRRSGRRRRRCPVPSRS